MNHANGRCESKWHKQLKLTLMNIKQHETYMHLPESYLHL